MLLKLNEDAEEYEEAFKKYFEHLTKHLAKKTCIKFSMTNSVFQSDEDAGIEVDELNKETSSPFFSYTLELKGKNRASRNEETYDFLNLKPHKIASF
jgi:hypothetical protein